MAEKNVVLVLEDQAEYEKIVKYHPGSGLNLRGNLPLEEYVKIREEILNDWYDKGYILTGYQMIKNRVFYVFTKR